MGLSLITPPAEEPVELFRLKEWLRVHPDIKDDDGLIYELAQAARDLIEGCWGVQMVTATWRLTVDSFYCWDGRLGRSPVQAVTSLTYRDAQGALTTLDPSRYELVATPSLEALRPAYGLYWPATWWHQGAVEVIFTAGFGPAPLVPGALKTAIKAAVLEWYEGRAAAGVLPEGAKNLVRRYWDGRMSA